MNDVAPALSAADIGRLRRSVVRNLLALLNSAEQIYGADWIVAYDLQHAKKLIEREQARLQESGAERADEDTNKEAARSASPR